MSYHLLSFITSNGVTCYLQELRSQNASEQEKEKTKQKLLTIQYASGKNLPFTKLRGQIECQKVGDRAVAGGGVSNTLIVYLMPLMYPAPVSRSKYGRVCGSDTKRWH